MVKSFYKNLDLATIDPKVGIGIFNLEKGEELQSFGTRMKAGTHVGCHSHQEGDEWYIILDGQGIMHLADVKEGKLTNKREEKVQKGDVLCVKENTGHQLQATTELDLIFLCPTSHLSSDRIMFDDGLIN